MKHLQLIAFFILLFALKVSAQQMRLKKGEEYYKTYSYAESIKKYEAVPKKTTDIIRKLAVSYYNIGKLKKAEKYWRIVIETNDYDADDVYKYASILSMNKNYVESERWMREFNKLKADDIRGQLWVNNEGFYKKLSEDKGKFTIAPLNINSKQQDFGVTYYKNQVVFASTRQPIEMIKRRWNWNELPFLDLYIANVDTSLQFLSYRKFYKKNINKKYHEGPASFNKEGDFMAFTRNNYEEKSIEGVVKLEIFTSKYKNGKWKKPKSVHFNNMEYSVGHPSLTADGKIMYFASDMPGGFGGVDLYRVYRKDDGSWTEPENLGDMINTEGNEMFPFVHHDNMLFFASNGLLGLGGLDIFAAQITKTGFGKPENVGVPVNSSYDDFAFILNDEKQSGYFSSNRLDGKGDDDIYLFRMSKPFEFGKLLRGVAMDQDSNILANTLVSLYDNNGDFMISTTTKEDGKYEWEIEQDKYYSLTGEKERYSEGYNIADSYTDEYIIYADLILKRSPKFSLYFQVTDANSFEPLEGVYVKFSNLLENSKEEIVTPKSGDFSRKLVNKKLDDSLSYEIRLEKDGYLSKTIIYNKTMDYEGVYDIHEELDLTMFEVEEGMDLGKILNLKPVYFDLNKSNIRPDAAIELNKIVKVLNDNPDMVVELGAHTDCRGTKTYNEKLSDRRAKSSAKYIQDRIVNPERIYGKGYGESNLINHCECEGAVKTSCSDEEHQMNRRTEFRIVKVK